VVSVGSTDPTLYAYMKHTNQGGLVLCNCMCDSK
jgi:hypothetical protein